MPLLSIFTPCGMLELSSRDPVPQGFYQSLIDSYGPAYDFTPGEHMEAKVYATAMALARAQNSVTRAGNQRHPGRIWDLILSKCKDWGVIPTPTDTIVSLNGKIAAQMLLRRGARTQICRRYSPAVAKLGVPKTVDSGTRPLSARPPLDHLHAPEPAAKL